MRVKGERLVGVLLLSVERILSTQRKNLPTQLTCKLTCIVYNFNLMKQEMTSELMKNNLASEDMQIKTRCQVM